MGLTNTIYNTVFKRTSTFALACIGSVFFFDRTFELASEKLFDTINQGKLYKDLKKE